MDRKEQLRKTVYTAQVELSAIEAEERDAANQALIGKCFRYSNSYGGGRDKWWLYTKVIGTEDGHLATFAFQTRDGDLIEIEPAKKIYFNDMSGDGGYEPITDDEFNAAWRTLAARIAELSP